MGMDGAAYQRHLKSTPPPPRAITPNELYGIKSKLKIKTYCPLLIIRSIYSIYTLYSIIIILVLFIFIYPLPWIIQNSFRPSSPHNKFPSSTFSWLRNIKERLIIYTWFITFVYIYMHTLHIYLSIYLSVYYIQYTSIHNVLVQTYVKYSS